jgi:hypothetical protein
MFSSPQKNKKNIDKTYRYQVVYLSPIKLGKVQIRTHDLKSKATQTRVDEDQETMEVYMCPFATF